MRKSKTKKIVKQAFHEVYASDTGKSKAQKTAIALSKARKRGAKVPKKGY